MTATPAGMTYADYLRLDQLLTAQQPLSALHDEIERPAGTMFADLPVQLGDIPSAHSVPNIVPNKCPI